MPPFSPYMAHYSKQTEAATLLAGLQWVQQLPLNQYPNHTNSHPCPLPIPIDNNSVVKDIHQTLCNQIPTFPSITYLLISPFSMSRGIRTEQNIGLLNSTLAPRSVSLLMERLVPSTNNHLEELVCSLHECLALMLPPFMVMLGSPS